MDRWGGSALPPLQKLAFWPLLSVQHLTVRTECVDEESNFFFVSKIVPYDKMRVQNIP
jgi:hypothetical protein